MPENNFPVITGMLCYNCCRTALVILNRSWGKVQRVGNESGVLDIVFVSCFRCQTLSHAHKPFRSLLPRYLDSQRYKTVTQEQHKTATQKRYRTVIDTLAHITEYTPSILERRAFSVTSLRFKTVTRIWDTLDIFDMPAVPDANIMILENGWENRHDCQFFHHDPYLTKRETRKYSKERRRFSDDEGLPFDILPNKPLILRTFWESVEPLLSNVEPPPPYVLQIPHASTKNSGKGKRKSLG